MATLSVVNKELHVHLSTLEAMGALMKSFSIPLSQIENVYFQKHAYTELHGIRVGTGLPFVIVLGRMFHSEGFDFVALYGTGRTLIVALKPDSRFCKLMLTGIDDQTAESLRLAIKKTE